MMKAAFSRRRFLRLTGGLALAGASLPLWAHDMAAMASGEEHPALRLAQPYKIKLAINKSAVCLAPVAVAEQQKIFSKYNLDVEFVNFGNSTDVLLEAIATGKADAGVGMALRWLKALEQGFDVKLTAGTHGGCLNLLTAKNSPFGGLESLKGQTIGVTDMAGPDKNFFAILLKRHGIDPISDVQWKVYPADLLSVALDKREIAAISGSEPFSYRLLATGKYQLSEAWPRQLSGGMAQRAALARALLNEPRLLLLDEPLGKLDSLTRISMQRELIALWQQQGYTSLLVTHDIEEALLLCDRVLIMSPRPGRIIAEFALPLAYPRHRDNPLLLQHRQDILRILGQGEDW